MDIRIDSNGEHFKFRVCGILTHNNKYLLCKMQQNQFYCFPGGHAEIGEDTETAIKREMAEELGFPVKIKKLTSIAQNLFTNLKGELVHELSFYYIVEAQNENDLNPNDYQVEECDKGVMKTLQFKWFTAEEMKNIDCRPNFATRILNPNKIVHIINTQNEITTEDEYSAE